MWIELEMQERERKGKIAGANIKLIEMVCKKLAKGKSAEVIANELEEELSDIEAICQAAKSFAPDYDVEKIYEAIELNEIK